MSLTSSLSLLPAKKEKNHTDLWSTSLLCLKILSHPSPFLSHPCSLLFPVSQWVQRVQNILPLVRNLGREVCKSGTCLDKAVWIWGPRADPLLPAPITFFSRVESAGSKWPHARIGQGNLGTLPQVCKEKEGAISHAQWEYAWSYKLQLVSLLCCFFPSFKKNQNVPLQSNLALGIP